MSIKSYESVDLTEDEDSNTSIVEGSKPFQFVDCNSGNVNNSTVGVSSTLSPPLTPIKSKVSPKKTPEVVNIKTFPLVNAVLQRNANLGIGVASPTSTNGSNASGKFISKFTSIQIKPPSTNKTMETQYISDVNTSKMLETVYIDSDDEDDSKNMVRIHHPKTTSLLNATSPLPNQTIYTRPPGKMVVIKKNNKYYKIVIPHNVVPSINQSTGPVLINIPEIGPLAISTDPIAKEKLIQIINNNKNQLTAGIPEKPAKENQVTPKEAALYDKRFCWSLAKGKKRDLDGFTFTDRLGFKKVETARAKKCFRLLESIINKKTYILSNKIKEFNHFIKSTNSKSFIKFIKIDELINNASQSSEKTTQMNLFSNKKKRIKPSPTLKTDSSIEKNSHFESDLLVTKKVVILNEDNKEVEMKTRKNRPMLKLGNRNKKNVKSRPAHSIRMKRLWAERHASRSQQIQTDVRKNIKHGDVVIKPCYIDMSKDEIAENIYKKQCKGSTFPKIEAGIKRKASKSLSNHEMEAFNFEKVSKLLISKIVKTHRHFISEIHYAKPLLIINEYNIHLRDYAKDCSKYNIVYVVKENRAFPKTLLRKGEFIDAVLSGYVKLIDCQLFCQFILDKTSFSMPQDEEFISEHHEDDNM